MQKKDFCVHRLKKIIFQKTPLQVFFWLKPYRGFLFYLGKYWLLGSMQKNFFCVHRSQVFTDLYRFLKTSWTFFRLFSEKLRFFMCNR